jgi:hypothetical protein
MKGAWSRLPPIVPALLLQCLAAGGTVLAVSLTGISLPLWLLALLCGALAALLSRLAGLERWWQIIQLLFPPAAAVLLTLQLRPWIYLVLFMALLLVYWSTYRTRVPLYLSGPRVWQAVRALLPPAEPARTLRVIDLGSGLGGLLLALAAARGDAEFHGVELAPLPLLISRLRIAWRRLRNCTVRWGSYWPVDLAPYDVVFAFLSPVPMSALWDKARREMRSGSLFISSSFEVPGQQATRVIDIDDARSTRLHVWTM